MNYPTFPCFTILEYSLRILLVEDNHRFYLPLFTDIEEAQLFKQRGPKGGLILSFSNFNDFRAFCEVKNSLTAEYGFEFIVAIDPIDQATVAEGRIIDVDTILERLSDLE